MICAVYFRQGETFQAINSVGGAVPLDIFRNPLFVRVLMSSGNEMRILIVEDELLIAMDLEDAVHSLGHTVVGPVTTLRQAKELAGDADFAFVDVRLGDGITGPEVAEHLHANGVTVVFTTGNPEAVRGSRAAIGIVRKPYSRRSIAKAVDYAVARMEGRQIDTPAELFALSEVL